MDTLSSGHVLAEAPRGLPDGSILFSDVVAGGVWRIPATGRRRPEVVIAKRRGVGGLLPHASGGIVVSGRDLALVEPDGETRSLLQPVGVMGINDIGSDGAGGVLAGALRFRPMAGEEPVPGEVWHLPADGSEPQIVADDVLWPNGIGLSPDGATLYVADFQAACVLAYDRDGGGRRIFAPSPRGSCDGLAVDAEGGVWVALGPGGGIGRLDADGALIEIIELDGAFVSSVSFAGDDDCDLLVTTADRVLRGHSPVPGLPVPAATL